MLRNKNYILTSNVDEVNENPLQITLIEVENKLDCTPLLAILDLVIFELIGGSRKTRGELPNCWPSPNGPQPKLCRDVKSWKWSRISCKLNSMGFPNKTAAGCLKSADEWHLPKLPND
uniref:Uncharacterized protein n=1 Tax=Glossina austeni TaxID=7395 RepID=A0A1A9VGM4_GLOAU